MSAAARGWPHDLWLGRLVPAGRQLKIPTVVVTVLLHTISCGTEATGMFETILTVFLHSRIPFLVLGHNVA